MEAQQKQPKVRRFLWRSFKNSLVIFFKETGLHGLKFVGDAALTIWERCFFLIAFVAAFILTCQLISNIYAKWNSTPVIIGISPHATSILKVPFPAVTICNMNQVQRSKVQHYKVKQNCLSSPSNLNLSVGVGFVPVAWNPETGYPKDLPKLFYPTTAVGTGITMGFTVVLDAQLNEYYCSSTNGPGFKLLFHNAISTPNLKEDGIMLGIGYETNFRLEFSISESHPNIRSIKRIDRQCVFNKEKVLLYHKDYTQKSCEDECRAKFLYNLCGCIPHKYPHIYKYARVCAVKDIFCERRAELENYKSEADKCRKLCLPSCFHLTYVADAFYIPLAKHDFRIANAKVAQLNKSYLLENVAVMNLYYRESAYYGTMKNVYFGLTEFLSNIGGVMGLFMGFSVISLAEVFYFLMLKPISELLLWQRGRQQLRNDPQPGKQQATPKKNKNEEIWYSSELYPKGIARKSTLANKH
ncbi:CG33289 [Drosophila busckii]|uniref:CG33289 n=1 Tax=Drosophila busckii TaxID=30019 RepID=A0A0M4E7J0_DROBS|nr:CG33289 [Drosophila busckii]